MAEKIEIFLSYAHKDKGLRDNMVEHLSLLKQQGCIAMWHDQDISAGTERQAAICEHLNKAQVILLLISPAFMASDHCYSTEMVRAIERHNAGEACVIPIILRPVDWHNAPFGKLQPLPADAQPITQVRNRDKAFFEVAQGIRKAIEGLKGDEATTVVRQQYCEALYKRWKMLDFKGIMHVDMNKPISIPLTEVFVPPDVLLGILEHETLEREGEQALWYRGRRVGRVAPQRETLATVLAQYQRLVLLGDPGSGKSTLLRYLLLQLAQGKDTFTSTFPLMEDVASSIPVYMPLATYAEALLANAPGNRSLADFLPVYLRDNYLGEFSDFVCGQLPRGKLFFLFDGLDEIPDSSLRINVARHIEMFTEAYATNRFIVTSRIVGYKIAPLSSDYQTYTLADFNEEQVRTFTQRWCPAYEYWVHHERESQHLEDAATEEAEKLFAATQSKPGVKRLAVNPLLLTILALIQRQGIDLPSHRIELFELCAMTLIDTWVKARGQTIRFSKGDIIKILRPLAFWMHEKENRELTR